MANPVRAIREKARGDGRFAAPGITAEVESDVAELASVQPGRVWHQLLLVVDRSATLPTG